jgi:hypothetical protein
VQPGDAEFVTHFTYNPSSPQEPSVSDEYKLTLTSDNDAACTFNRASITRVKSGNYVTLTANVNQGYEFLGWYKGTTLINSNHSFSYQMPAEDVTLVAKFRYNPFNPTEPEGDGSQNDVQTTVKGDINADGEVNVGDFAALANIIFNSEEIDETTKSVSDINADGEVNVGDFAALVNLIFNSSSY